MGVAIGGENDGFTVYHHGNNNSTDTKVKNTRETNCYTAGDKSVTVHVFLFITVHSLKKDYLKSQDR